MQEPDLDGYDAYGYDASLYGEFDPYEYYWNQADIQTEPPSEIVSNDDLDAFLTYDDSQAVVMGYFGEDEDSQKNMEVFLSVCDEFYTG